MSQNIALQMKGIPEEYVPSTGGRFDIASPVYAS